MTAFVREPSRPEQTWPGRLQTGAVALAIAGLLAAASPAAAAAFTNTAQIELSGTIPPTCGFTTLPANPDLGVLATGSVVTIGALAFTCNLAASGPVAITIQTTNGALKRDGGPETAAYDAAWDVQGRDGDFGNASAWTSPTTFQLVSGLSGVAQSGAYKIRITGPTANLPAGTYRDTITYTITP